ncbi:hypothetical protein PGB28_20195 [Primorskyibacter aestuariivivens]|uniref:hypothetical protein n=1 Tax=Primorskyibacter aestuariivivens TaxID=1888912 RepID=UPI002300DA08|nr:hypothetical protein [Primorskyibacter aestuariivivens]MDA7430789.1 hypothetical protein [Primorskyibacter aestuariivivens]
MRMIPALLALLTGLLTAVAVSAQDDVPIFDNYLSLRAVLDAQMKNRDIAEVMTTFGGSSPPEELEALEARVREIFPRDFENAALLRRNEMENGWRQELIAYWTGIDYIYVYLLLHDRDEGLLSVTMRFNTDFDELNAAF